jgi:hypothetical protein
MDKLSPGGWHRGVGNGEGSIFADEGRMRFEKNGTTLYPICKMIQGWKPEEDEAHANLIAAAPDLLVQLQKTLLDLEDFSSDEGEFEWTFAAGRQICREIEKVIAKAVPRRTPPQGKIP